MTHQPMAFYMRDKPPILQQWQRPFYFAFCFVGLMWGAARQCWWMSRIATAMTKPTQVGKS